jgi:hypothetical protein
VQSAALSTVTWSESSTRGPGSKPRQYQRVRDRGGYNFVLEQMGTSALPGSAFTMRRSRVSSTCSSIARDDLARYRGCAHVPGDSVQPLRVMCASTRHGKPRAEVVPLRRAARRHLRGCEIERLGAPPSSRAVRRARAPGRMRSYGSGQPAVSGVCHQMEHDGSPVPSAAPTYHPAKPLETAPYSPACASQTSPRK